MCYDFFILMHSSAFTVAAAVDKTICDHTCDRQNTWRLLVQKDLGLKGKKKTIMFKRQCKTPL